MWGYSRTLWAMFVCAVMLLGTLVVVVGAPPEEKPNAPEDPEPTDCLNGSSERVVLIEDYTAQWCPYCPPQAFATNRLYDELGHENLVLLEHHPSTTDPLYNAESRSRGFDYNLDALFYPTVVADGGFYYKEPNGGVLWESGGTTKWQKYQDDKDNYLIQKGTTTNLTITLTGDITSSQGRVFAHIEATDPISETNLKVRLMVYESNLYLSGASETYGHHRVYNHIVRDILPAEDVPVTFDDMGDVLDVERVFTINPGWDVRNLGIAVFVQTENTREWTYWSGGNPYRRLNAPVLQAASLDFVDAGVLIVDANDNDNMALEFDAYDEVLVKENIPHRNWDTDEPLDSEADNVRAKPIFPDIEEYSAVIWFTSSDTTTLPAGSRTAIEDYINDKGNLFISGEEIANDANVNMWDVWMGTNLYAVFVADSSVDSSVEGVFGDPITDGITNLPFTHSSPDIIDTLGSSEIFTYTSNPLDVAGVRADHDGDSRVIYLSFDYFETTNTEDFDAREETLMSNMIEWLDWASAPHVDVLTPDGGEVLDKLTQYEIYWDAKDVEWPTSPHPVWIEYTTDSAFPVWIPITSDEPDDGVYAWTTPDVDSSTCRVRVCALDSVGQSNCAISDGDFTIGVPMDTTPPEIKNVLLDGLPSRTVNVGDVVTVTATIEDSESNIVAANYTIDMDWLSSTPMDPLDGSYDELFEFVTSDPSYNIDTAGWLDATYTVCVHASDVAFNDNVTFSACASLEVTSIPVETEPPQISNVLIDGQSPATYFFSSKPPDFVLTATVDDTNTGGSNIDGARYKIDAAGPWPMVAADMFFDEIVEDVIALAIMPDWPGYYQVCVYAWDDKTNLNSTGACADFVIVDDLPPEISNVLVNDSVSSSVRIGTPVFLNATISDVNTGNLNIAAANYTDGAGNFASSLPMLAVDGNFDEPVEDVTAVIDTSGMSLGLHSICVYAEDSWPSYNLIGVCVSLDVVGFGPAPPVMLDAQLMGVGLADVLVTWQRSGDDGIGMDNVVNYQLYSATSYGGPYALEQSFPATDQPTYQYTCTGYGYGNPSNFFFYVEAFNNILTSASPNMAAKFIRHLTTGVQLVSVPLVLSDTSIGTVFQTIQVAKVWTHDSSDDSWSSYMEAKPYKGDLWNIYHQKGYWVDVLIEDDFVVAGLVPAVTQIQLYRGWNLISFPSFKTAFTVADMKLLVSGIMRIEGYDPTDPYCLKLLLDTDVLMAGNGYWVHSTVNTVLNVWQ